MSNAYELYNDIKKKTDAGIKRAQAKQKKNTLPTQADNDKNKKKKSDSLTSGVTVSEGSKKNTKKTLPTKSNERSKVTHNNTSERAKANKNNGLNASKLDDFFEKVEGANKKAKERIENKSPNTYSYSEQHNVKDYNKNAITDIRTKDFKEAGEAFLPSVKTGVKGIEKNLVNAPMAVGDLVSTGANKLLELTGSNKRLDYFSDAIKDTAYGKKASETTQKANKSKEDLNAFLQDKGRLAKNVSEVSETLPEIGLNLAMAVGTAGAGSAAKFSTEALNVIANAQKAGKAVKIAEKLTTIAKNPMMWQSFLEITGGTYADAIENGATKDRASVAAVANGVIGTAIEMGGGIEKLATEGVTIKTIEDLTKEILSSMGEEASEEFVQAIVENAIKQATGIANTNIAKDGWGAIFSTESGKDSLINVPDMANASVMGAFGGMLGASPMLALNYMGNRNLPNTDVANTSMQDAATAAIEARTPAEQSIQEVADRIAQGTTQEVQPKADTTAIEEVAQRIAGENYTVNDSAEVNTETEAVAQRIAGDNSFTNEGAVKEAKDSLKANNNSETSLESKAAELSKSQKTIDKVVKMVEKRSGLKVVFDEDIVSPEGKRVNGYYDGNEIHVSKSAKNPVFEIIKHELTHHIESSNMYKDFKDFILDGMEDSGFNIDKIKEEYKAAYKELYKNSENFDEDIEREIVAEFCGEYLFNDEKSINRLVNNNPNLARRILNWIDDLIASFKNKRADDKERQFLLDAQKMYVEALRTADSKQGENKKYVLADLDSNINRLNKYKAPAEKAAKAFKREANWLTTEEDIWNAVNNTWKESGIFVDTDLLGNSTVKTEIPDPPLNEGLSMSGEFDEPNMETYSIDAEDSADDIEEKIALNDAARIVSDIVNNAENGKKYLYNYLNHTELFEHYPYLAGNEVVIDRSLGNKLGSFFVENGKGIIRLNDKAISKFANDEHIDEDEAFYRVLLHETQHGIQSYSNMAGGVPGNYDYTEAGLNALLSRFSKGAKEVFDFADGDANTKNRIIAESEQSFYSKLGFDMRESIFNGTAYKLSYKKNFEGYGLKNELHNSIAGEKDASVVQNRALLTKEQRKNMPPVSKAYSGMKGDNSTIKWYSGDVFDDIYSSVSNGITKNENVYEVLRYLKDSGLSENFKYVNQPITFSIAEKKHGIDEIRRKANRLFEHIDSVPNVYRTSNESVDKALSFLQNHPDYSGTKEYGRLNDLEEGYLAAFRNEENSKQKNTYKEKVKQIRQQKISVVSSVLMALDANPDFNASSEASRVQYSLGNSLENSRLKEKSENLYGVSGKTKSDWEYEWDAILSPIERPNGKYENKRQKEVVITGKDQRDADRNRNGLPSNKREVYTRQADANDAFSREMTSSKDEAKNALLEWEESKRKAKQQRRSDAFVDYYPKGGFEWEDALDRKISEQAQGEVKLPTSQKKYSDGQATLKNDSLKEKSENLFDGKRTKETENARPYEEQKDIYGTYENGTAKAIDGVEVSKGADKAYGTYGTNEEMAKVINESIQEGGYSKVTITNKTLKEDAKKALKSLGADTLASNFTNKLFEGEGINSQDIVNAYTAVESLVGAKKYAEANKLLQNIVVAESELGRTLQASGIFKKQTPIWQMETMIKQANRIGMKHNVNIEIPEHMQQSFIRARTQAKRNRIAKEINTLVWEQIPSTVMEKLDALRFAGMLSAPSTHVRNIAGNMGMYVLTRFSNTLEAGLQSTSFYENKVKSLREKVDVGITLTKNKNTNQYILDFGETQIAETQYDYLKANGFKYNRNQNRFYAPVNENTKKISDGVIEAAKIAAIAERENNSDSYERIAEEIDTSKNKAILTVMDKPLVQYAERLYKTKYGDGTYFGPRKYLSENTMRPDDVHVFNSKTVGGRALNWYSESVSNLLEFEDRKAIGAIFKVAFAQICKANGADWHNLSEAQIQAYSEYAMNEAKKATFRDANRFADAVNGLYSYFANYSESKGAAKVGKFAGKIAMDTLMPFVRTPANILKQGYRYSPAGLINGIGKIATAQTAEDFMDGINMFSNGVIGTPVLLAGMYMAAQGLAQASFGSGDKEDKYEQTKGNQAYSIMVGDNVIPMDWFAPAAMPFFVGVNLAQTLTDDNGEFNLAGMEWDEFMDKMASSVDPMLEMSLLSGIQDFMTAAKYSEGNMWDFTTYLGESYFSQHLPNWVAKIAKYTSPTLKTAGVKDNTVTGKTAERMIATFKSKIPGLYDTLPDKVDLWGRTVKKESLEDWANGFSKEAFKGLVKAFVSPSNTTKYLETDVDKAVTRLFRATNNASVLPSAPNNGSNKLELNGEKYELNEKQFAEFQKLAGQEKFKKIQELIKSPNYNRMSNDEKVKAITNIYSEANSNAKFTILEKEGIITHDDAMYAQLSSHSKKLVDEGAITLKTVYEMERTASDVTSEYYMRMDSGSGIDIYAALSPAFSDEDIQTRYSQKVSDTTIKKAKQARNLGIQPTSISDITSNADKNGNSNISADEANAYVAQHYGNLSQEQKYYLVLAASGSTSSKNAYYSSSLYKKYKGYL